MASVVPAFQPLPAGSQILSASAASSSVATLFSATQNYSLSVINRGNADAFISLTTATATASVTTDQLIPAGAFVILGRDLATRALNAITAGTVVPLYICQGDYI
jgi:hypothetical protein